MPENLHPTIKYDIYWARSVVNRTLENHGRVRDSFLEFTGMDREKLALLLARGRPEWALLRDMLKLGDIWTSKQVSLGIAYGSTATTQLWSTILHTKRNILPDKLYNYLDKQLKLPNT
jgi:hypothetical protein